METVPLREVGEQDADFTREAVEALVERLGEAEARLAGVAKGITPRAIRVTVYVTPDTRPKELSNVLDEAFEDWDAVLQFTVQGDGDEGRLA